MGNVLPDRGYGDFPEVRLCTLYRMGDTRAFEELWWTRHRTVLEARARAWSFRDDDLAAEALEQTENKLRQPEKWSSYDPTQPWLPWASQVLRRTVIDTHRRGARRATVPLEEDGPADRSGDDPWTRMDIQNCLDRLSALHKRVLILRFYSHKTNEETATILGITGPRASQHKTVALRQLKECLEGYGGDQ